MQLQKSLLRHSCYFIICMFFFAASGFIFHLLWKRQYDKNLKPYSIKLHLCNLTNFNRLQNFANGSSSNDTTKLKVILLPWVILVRSNSSDSLINFDGLWNSFFLRCDYNMTVTLKLFSQGSETYATLLPSFPFPNLWVHWAFQTSEIHSALKDSKFLYILWKLIVRDGSKLVLPLRKASCSSASWPITTDIMNRQSAHAYFSNNICCHILSQTAKRHGKEQEEVLEH